MFEALMSQSKMECLLLFVEGHQVSMTYEHCGYIKIGECILFLSIFNISLVFFFLFLGPLPLVPFDPKAFTDWLTFWLNFMSQV